MVAPGIFSNVFWTFTPDQDRLLDIYSISDGCDGWMCNCPSEIFRPWV